jgi:anaerobic magnesium-protoporphyrin IX monomethyl ester cyclase
MGNPLDVSSGLKIDPLVFHASSSTVSPRRFDSARVLLCVLPYLVSQPDVPVPGKSVRSFLAFPYGVLTMASYIRKRAVPKPDVRILDFNLFLTDDERIDALRRAIDETNPEIVGFSMSYDISYMHVGKFAAEVKHLSPDSLTVMGGPAVTTAWEEILGEQPAIDALCYSESERAMLALVEAVDMRAELERDPWVTRRSLDSGRTPHAVVPDNLNDVIHLDYEMVESRRYSMKEAFSPFATYRNDGNTKQFFIVTSRGCPFKCVFCAEPSFHGKTMRYAEVDVIIDHVRQLVERYGMNVLTIYDDQLLIDQPRAKDLFRKLAEFKLRVEMPNGITLSFIDEELAYLMKKGGVDTVFLAIESGSDYVLKKIIKKPLRLDKAKGIIDSLRKNDIFVQSFFIIGFPGETEAHREETRAFIRDAGIDWSFFNYATPLRGSELFKTCVENGWIDSKFVGIGRVDMSEYIIRAPGLDPEYITDQIYRMNLEANFVYNHRMRMGDFKTAKRCFEEVLERHPGHPFALYFLAEALQALGTDGPLIQNVRREYADIVSTSARWRDLAASFGMPTSI